MKISSSRILTTHVGSLPRPLDLLGLMEAREKGEAIDAARLAAGTKAAIADIVAQQVEAGVDIVNDGENSKISYTFYVRHRLGGVGHPPAGRKPPRAAPHKDLAEHPDLVEMTARRTVGLRWYDLAAPPCCIGPVTYADRGPLEADIANLAAAVSAHGGDIADAFMNAASPGVLTKFVPDLHYGNEDAYVAALADAMAVEYEAITRAGLILQIDAPDLGSARHNQYAHLSEDEFLKVAARNVEAINHATRNIPPDRMRIHICWGNYEGPHTHDIPFVKVLPTLLKARPQAILFEGANPAHAHEWEDLKAARIPDDKVLIPGVIDSTTNFVENPRLVAQRILNYASIVGRERVIAGTDCGFATFAGPSNPVAPSVVWAKLEAMAEGARLATQKLW